jgi:glucose/mannose transport system substrate-binding protein
MQFMGDWAKGEFVAAGKTGEVDYGCVLSPGNVNFQMVGDVFVFPKTDDAAVTEAQNKLASVMMNPETQVLFNSKKGSVPVRSDVDTSQLDPCASKGLAVAADKSKQIPGVDFLLTTDLATTLQDTISVYWNSPEMTVDQFVEAFISTIDSAGG